MGNAIVATIVIPIALIAIPLCCSDDPCRDIDIMHHNIQSMPKVRTETVYVRDHIGGHYETRLKIK